MLVAVPPSSLPAPFLVLQAASLISSHFIPAFASSLSSIPFRLHSYQQLVSPAGASYYGSPACRSGLRDGKGFGKLFCFNDYIFNNLTLAIPCVVNNRGCSRPHSASLHCGLFLLPPLAPFAVVRQWSLNLFRLQTASLIAASTSFGAVGTITLALAFSRPHIPLNILTVDINLLRLIFRKSLIKPYAKLSHRQRTVNAKPFGFIHFIMNC